MSPQRPDLAAVRALAECGELAAAVSGLTGAGGGPLRSPAGHLAREIARELVGAGFPVHRCSAGIRSGGSAASACGRSRSGPARRAPAG